jgi:hypothetical protein
MARKFEGSPKDIRQDKRGAKKLGVPLKAYENTARDKAEDRAGQSNMGRPNQRTNFSKGKAR